LRRILYEPPPERSGPRAARLEKKLLELCKQDGRLRDRLLGHERSLRPHLPREELLRLAIEHLEKDNR
jgi:hypothetical protein